MSHISPHQDCLNFATILSLRSASFVGNMLLRKFYVAAAFKADAIIRSVNKMQATSKCNTVAQCYVSISKQLHIKFSLRTETVFALLNLPSNFVSVCQTAPKFCQSLGSVCHVNRHRRDISKWSKISFRTEIWGGPQLSDSLLVRQNNSPTEQ